VGRGPLSPCCIPTLRSVGAHGHYLELAPLLAPLHVSGARELNENEGKMLPKRRVHNDWISTAGLLGLAVVLALGGSAMTALSALCDVGFTLRTSEKERVLQTTWEVGQLSPGEQIWLPGMVDPVNP